MANDYDKIIKENICVAYGKKLKNKYKRCRLHLILRKTLYTSREKKEEKLITSFLKNTNLSVSDIAKAAGVSQKYVKELKVKHT